MQPMPKATAATTRPAVGLNRRGWVPLRLVAAGGVTIAGQRLQPTPVFDTYWRFAAERQKVYEDRMKGAIGPWSGDDIIAKHRFTNCYRAADRVSQYLIRNVIYAGSQDPREVVFRILLFKFFNKISTWQTLVTELGTPTFADFDTDRYDRTLSAAFGSGQRLYSAAYVVPPPQLGAERKHTNHLRLINSMMADGLADQLRSCGRMSDAFGLLKSYPSIGDFLAFQLLTDINYSNVVDFDEMDFVVPGPGARDGVRKCFGAQSRGFEAEIIRYMADTQEMHFDRLGLEFKGLKGRRLQLIDCQNLFCEVDKYARVAHPDVQGYSGRSRIKQHFTPLGEPVVPWFPPKWGIN